MGLRINYDKSVVCTLGKKDHIYASLFSRQYKWLKRGQYFTYLGLKLGLDEKGCMIGGDDFLDSRSKLDLAVAAMPYSFTSVLGKILQVKTLLASKMVYFLTLLPSPYLHTLWALDRYYYAFVWQGGCHRVAKETMQLDVSRGGFNMLNVYLQECSLKFVWLHRTFTNEQDPLLWQQYILNAFVITFPSLITA